MRGRITSAPGGIAACRGARLHPGPAAALTQFEKTLEATRAGRRDHVGASADLRAVITEITEQVRVLDGLVRYRFSDNAELMGAWASARDVLGPFRSKSEAPADGGQAPGTGSDAVKSAA